ncbi:Leucine rich repeat-containing protein [Ruminococcaceae bacterium FB2012]|nr:Leucine rich repeat-containing protein [Ruminococcaceae bacterium FB2012]
MQDRFIIENGTLVSFKGEEHSVIIPEGVKVIGKEVFRGMAWITDVTLPEGLVGIEDSAFKGCRQLKSIGFPTSLKSIGELAFHRCHSLEEVILPEAVTSLGKGTFLYCDGLETIIAPGAKKLGTQAFANCTHLRSITLNSRIDCSNFKNDVFTGCLGIKEISLSDGYSYHTDNLINALISDGEVHPVVRAAAESLYRSIEIEDGVLFKLHVDLRTFELPEGIKAVGKGCFLDKKGIVSITFPESLERIGSNAFGNCISLEQITLKDPHVTVEEGAFRGCSSLKRVVIGDRIYTLGGIDCAGGTPRIIRQISDQLISDFYISGKVLMSYTGSEERVTVPEGVEVIGESCFEGNERLDRVLLPDSVREIHENAFRNCICMQSVVMPEGLRAIRRSAFENCRKLIRFNVPAGLEEVGFAAFRGCVSLETEGFETGTPAAVRVPDRVYGENDIPAYRYCFDGSFTELVPDKPGIIGKYAFSVCPELRSVVINAPGCIVEKYAFEKCGSLKKIKVTAGRIEKGAFSFCRELEEAEIDGVTELEEEVFAGCSSLKKIRLPEGLSRIGRRCFDECTSLPGFDFSGIRHIGERAFERCDSLKEVRLIKAEVGYHAFADCAGLETILLDGETRLQSGAFFGCTFADRVVFCGTEYPFSEFAQSRNTAGSLLPVRVQEVIGSVYSCFEVSRRNSIVRYKGDASKVRIPEDIVSAGDEAFRDRLRVEDIRFPAGFSRSGRMTFSGTGWLERKRREAEFTVVNGLLIDAAGCGEKAVIDGSISRICSWAFAGNTRIKELVLRSSRTAADCFAFRNCINLKTVTCADGKTYTLESCTDLTEKDYPETVRRIFSECINCFKLEGEGVLTESTGNIKELVFPEGIKEIAPQVYMDCNLLESIVLSKDTKIIGKCAFKNSKWLRRVGNAEGVERIDALAFSGCKSLESISLSDALEDLGKRAFEHCCELKEIHISNKLTVIPERAFFRCKSLKRVFIPASVKEIGTQAFAFCSELEEVIFEDRDGVSIAEDAFAWCDKL